MFHDHVHRFKSINKTSLYHAYHQKMALDLFTIQSRILFSLIALLCKSPRVKDIKSDTLRLKTAVNGERHAFSTTAHISFDFNQLDD